MVPAGPCCDQERASRNSRRGRALERSRRRIRVQRWSVHRRGHARELRVCLAGQEARRPCHRPDSARVRVAVQLRDPSAGLRLARAGVLALLLLTPDRRCCRRRSRCRAAGRFQRRHPSHVFLHLAAISPARMPWSPARPAARVRRPRRPAESSVVSRQCRRRRDSRSRRGRQRRPRRTCRLPARAPGEACQRRCGRTSTPDRPCRRRTPGR